MKNLRKVRAFTLIELIVVIVIIGILLALAAVGYLSFVQNSNKKASFANVKQASTIIQGASSTAQKKATVLTAAQMPLAGDGVTLRNGANTDGVLVVKAGADVTADVDMVVCGYKGGQVSSATFLTANAAGSPVSNVQDVSGGGTAAALCPAAGAAVGTGNVAVLGT